MRSAKGSIQKLGKDRYRVFVSVTDGYTGTRSRRSRVVRGSHRKAEGSKLALLAEAKDGMYASRMTLAAYADVVYMPHVLATHKPRTAGRPPTGCGCT